MLPDWLPESLWSEMRKNRKKIGYPMTEYAEELMIEKLSRWKAGGADPIAILKESIERGYRGVFLNGHTKDFPEAEKMVCAKCRKPSVSLIMTREGKLCVECRG